MKVIDHPQSDESKVDPQPVKTTVDAQSNNLKDLEDKLDANQNVLTKAANVIKITEHFQRDINSHGGRVCRS